MSPRLAIALSKAATARRSRERAAALGKCPTCRTPIQGLDPVASRPRPWRYCDDCHQDDRVRKVARVDPTRKRPYAPRRSA